MICVKAVECLDTRYVHNAFYFPTSVVNQISPFCRYFSWPVQETVDLDYNHHSISHLFCLGGSIELKLDKNVNVPTCAYPDVVLCGAIQQRLPEVLEYTQGWRVNGCQWQLPQIPSHLVMWMATEDYSRGWWKIEHGMYSVLDCQAWGWGPTGLDLTWWDMIRRRAFLEKTAHCLWIQR